MNKRFYSTLLTIVGACSIAFAQGNPIDTTKYVSYEKYDCVQDSAYGHLEVPGTRKYLDVFQSKLSEALTTGEGRVNILHIGGSHVQGGSYPHKLRTNFANLTSTAAADRGFVFPFKVIRTNAPSNYQFTFTGQWNRSRCIAKDLDAVLGVCGAAAITNSEDCSLTMDLKDNGKWAFDAVRLLGYPSDSTVVPYVLFDGQKIYADKEDKSTGYLFRLPKMTSTCTFGFDSLSLTSKFNVRGMLPMSNRPGITYTESGVNGASTISWLRCKMFNEELSLLPPDLVIFGIGINDADGSPFDVDRFKRNYREIMNNIRTINPNAQFLFITNNDCWHARRYNPNTPVVEEAFFDLAKEYDGCVYNVFRLMGGPRSANDWVSAKLMEPDHVHFTSTGYRLLGDILFNALIEDNINNAK